MIVHSLSDLVILDIVEKPVSVLHHNIDARVYSGRRRHPAPRLGRGGPARCGRPT